MEWGWWTCANFIDCIFTKNGCCDNGQNCNPANIANNCGHLDSIFVGNNNKTSNNDDIKKIKMIMNGMCHNIDIMLITTYLNTIFILIRTR